MKHFILSALIGAMLAGPAWAEPASTLSYRQGVKQMHHDMDIIYSGQTDSDFARGMIPHHQGAVAMAETVLQYGQDEDVLSLARWIRISQLAEIGQMERWISRRAVPEPTTEPDSAKTDASVLEYKSAMHQMHKGMDIVYSGNPELDFVCGMIPHHMGAIHMASTMVRYGRDPEMIRLARAILPSQRSDIARMQRWLKRNNMSCSAAQDCQHHH